MASTFHYFRDTLQINLNTIRALNAPGGATIVFGARAITLSELVSGYSYVIATDELTLAPGAAAAIENSDGTTPTSVTVLARKIDGALRASVAGVAGPDGADGEPGESGIVDDVEDRPGRPPIRLPGGAGGNGEDGGDGAPGGNITVRYALATAPPTAAAPGGPGGAAGQGGPGGPGRPPGRPGKAGRRGSSGTSGVISVQQIPAEQVFQSLDPASAVGWAAYRAEVAGFLLRKFDFDSQLAALNEAGEALLLNPADEEAATVQSRIILRQIPSGLPRDLDIAPDYPALSANLPAEIAIVQNAFQAFVSVVSLETIADTIREQLRVLRMQLENRTEEAQADVVIANGDVAIAQAEKVNVQKQIDLIQKDIIAAQNQSFSLGGLLTTVGTIAAGLAGMASGPGAIISIAAGIASLNNLAGTSANVGILIGELGNAAKDPKNKTKLEQDVANVNGLGGDLKDLISGTKSVISFVKVVSDLDGAISGSSSQSQVGKLLREKAKLTRDHMVASMRERQAKARVLASEMRVANLISEMEQIDDRLEHWSTEIAVLNAAAELLIRAARHVVDMVMDDVFLAQRAREIYQLEGTPNLRFDFGYLHPDTERSLSPALRAAATLVSLAGMPIQILAWNQMFQQLNSAQIGFDVIHPQLSVTITDPVQLQAFATGSALRVTIGLESVPSGMFELKANALSLELNKAVTSQSANIWVTHSGEWAMNRRTDGSVTTMLLRPRREVFAIAAGSGILRSSIPANPQSNSESGPPFSFWGRGTATTFTLELSQPSTLDLSQLTAIHVTVDCIAFAPQATATEITIPADVAVVVPMALAEAAVA
jgi:hypothetical protein